MRNKVGIVIIFLVFVILAAGCETAKGLGKGAAGIACGVGSTVEGVGKDSYNFWKFIQAADSWMKENLW